MRNAPRIVGSVCVLCVLKCTCKEARDRSERAIAVCAVSGADKVNAAANCSAAHYSANCNAGLEVNMIDNYITGNVIKKLRESKKMTQEELAEKIFVTGKAVSKWETGQGFPDISLVEPLAKALDISVIELLSGECIQNRNRVSNMFKSKFYVCPVCGNVIRTIGEAMISCCGITLPPLEPETETCENVTGSQQPAAGEEPAADGARVSETADTSHVICVESVEDEYYVHLDHPMTKEHYISFIAAVSDQGVQFVKLYPEQAAEARFKRSRVKYLYAYCNHHGLFKVKV